MKSIAKKMKALLILCIVMTLVFSMGTSTFAVTGIPDNNGQYLEGDAIPPNSSTECASYIVSQGTASTSITVKMVVEAGDTISDFNLIPNTRFRKEFNITLTNSTPKNFTVHDAVLAANNISSTNDLLFNIITTSTGPYVDHIDSNGQRWKSSQLGFDGWVFRINDKYPVQQTSDGVGYEGTGINQTFIHDGDVIHWFYDFPSQLEPGIPSCSASYVRATLVNSDSSQVTVQLQGHKMNIAPTNPYIVTIDNYSNLSQGVVAKIYSVSDLNNPIATGTSTSNGTVEFNGNFSSGTYVVKTDSTYYACPSSNWSWLVDGAYFMLTGTYSKITL